MNELDKVVGIHHFNLTVTDVERSVDFYTNLLGFQLRSVADYVWDPEYGTALLGGHHPISADKGIAARLAVVELNGMSIELMQMLEPATDRYHGDASIAGSAHIAIKVRNIHETCKRLRAAGVEVLYDVAPFQEPGAAPHIWCPIRDPDGIIVELVQETSTATLTEKLGLRIREARSVRGLTLRELSAICDISAAHLSQVERGDALPSIPALVSISSALAVSADYFLRLLSENEGSIDLAGLPKTAVIKASRASGGSGARFATIEESQARTISGDVQWRWLTDPHEDVRVFQVRYEVGSGSEDAAVGQTGTEIMLVLEGILEVHLGATAKTLGPGSSLTYGRSTPRRISNVGKVPALAHCVVAPHQAFTESVNAARG